MYHWNFEITQNENVIFKTAELQPRLRSLLSKARQDVLKTLHTLILLAILKISVVYVSGIYASKESERYF